MRQLLADILSAPIIIHLLPSGRMAWRKRTVLYARDEAITDSIGLPVYGVATEDDARRIRDRLCTEYKGNWYWVEFAERVNSLPDGKQTDALEWANQRMRESEGLET